MQNILHINCNYMGTKLHQTMIEHLDECDVRNSVFCPIYSGSQIVVKPRDNVTVSKCFSFFDRFLFFIKQKKILRAIQRSYDISDFSCIHAYTLFTDGNAAYCLSKKYNRPYVVAIRATDLLFFNYRPYLRWRGIKILKRASAIFFLSETTKQVFFQSYINPSDTAFLQSKSYIIPNGIDDFWLSHKAESKKKSLEKEKPIHIVCVAKIIKRKNIPALQKAIWLLNAKGWNMNLTLIGEGTDKSELNKILDDRNTEYVPPVSKEKLIDYYRKSDIFVLPSKGETFGLVYAEAMSQGLPVLYSAGEGFDGQFEEGVVGYRVDPDSEDDIAEKLTEIVANYSEICDRVAACSERYKWDDIVKQYADLYDQLSGDTVS